MEEEQQLTKQERHQRNKQHNREERQKEQRNAKIKKMLTITAIILFVGGGIIALAVSSSKAPHLPPTSQINHSENSPPAHIITRSIPEGIQRHMLEHADGVGPAGIIIQYNCDDFECEPGLVEQLTQLVQEYPDNVYLAPNKYDGKIILTKEGRIEVLDNFDEEAIRKFIGRGGSNISSNGREQESSVKEVSMVSGDLFFNPENLTLVKDQSVKITFQNTGSHTFTIDELGVHVVLSGSSATVEFIPTQSGTFEYYCAVPGHREGGMFGSLTVE